MANSLESNPFAALFGSIEQAKEFCHETAKIINDASGDSHYSKEEANGSPVSPASITEGMF